VVFALKGDTSCHNLEDGNTHSPQINPFIISSTNENLWGHEVVSANDCQHFSSLSSEEGFLGDAKVNEFDFFLLFVE